MLSKLNQVKFTILIPTFNRIDYVIKTINSVLNQDYQNYDIIVSDNNSTDGTYKKLLQLYIQNNIKIYKQDTNIGFAKNLNFLLQKATSDYMIILSDDDMMTKYYLSEVVKVIKATNKKFIFTNAFLINQNDQIIGQFVKSKIPESTSLKKLFSFKSNPVNLNTVSISLDLVKEIGYMDLNMKEVIDYDYWLRCANKNIDYFYINKKLVKYRIHDSSLTNLSNESLLIHTLKTLKKNNKDKNFSYMINISIINFIVNYNLKTQLIKEIFPKKSIFIWTIYKLRFFLKYSLLFAKTIKNKILW